MPHFTTRPFHDELKTFECLVLKCNFGKMVNEEEDKAKAKAEAILSRKRKLRPILMARRDRLRRKLDFYQKELADLKADLKRSSVKSPPTSPRPSRGTPSSNRQLPTSFPLKQPSE